MLERTARGHIVRQTPADDVTAEHGTGGTRHEAPHPTRLRHLQVVDIIEKARHLLGSNAMGRTKMGNGNPLVANAKVHFMKVFAAGPDAWRIYCRPR